LTYASLHKILGIILLIPLLGWSLTGIVFLVQPGYEGAYERIALKTYPLEREFHVKRAGNWHESRMVRSVLGYHLLVNDGDTWWHLDPSTLEVKSLPASAEVERLVVDALAFNTSRYGNVVSVSADKIYTDTGVEITLDWPTLTLHQVGSDTRLINTLYKAHYLQWLGVPLANTILGALGIVLLFFLVVLGILSFIKSLQQR
jgi:hypothetical protein